jgi:hypothetical protein
MKLTPFYVTHKRALLRRLRSMRAELDHAITLIEISNPDVDTAVDPRDAIERSISNVLDEAYIITELKGN